MILAPATNDTATIQVDCQMAIRRAVAPKGHVAASPLGAVGGKPTREHRIRVRTQRSERLQSPALGVAPPSQAAALTPRALRWNRPASRETIKSHLAYVNLTDAFFKQMFYRFLKGLLRKGYAPRWPTHGYKATREAAMAVSYP